VYVESFWPKEQVVIVRVLPAQVPFLLTLPGISACVRRRDFKLGIAREDV